MWTLAVQNSDELIYIMVSIACSDCRNSLEVFQFGTFFFGCTAHDV